MTTGNLIMINGPSSAGKSTLGLAIREQIDHPFLCFSFDLFLDNNVLPMPQIRSGRFSWPAMRPQVFTGIYHCLPALLDAGNNLIFDTIFETAAGRDELVAVLSGYDVFLVGVHCSVEELERREHARGDRRVGDARKDLETVHTFTPYDFEVNTENPPTENAAAIVTAWHRRTRPSVFETLSTNIKR